MTAHETVCAVVEAELDRRGMTHKQLAAMVGRTPPWLSKKMSGDRRWSVDDLELLSDRLGMPAASLLMAPVRVATREYRRLAVAVTRWYLPHVSRVTGVAA